MCPELREAGCCLGLDCSRQAAFGGPSGCLFWLPFGLSVQAPHPANADPNRLEAEAEIT